MEINASSKGVNIWLPRWRNALPCLVSKQCIFLRRVLLYITFVFVSERITVFFIDILWIYSLIFNVLIFIFIMILMLFTTSGKS